MKKYRRRLPHLDAPGVPSFVTFRLFGSLPAGRTFDPEHLHSGEAFVAFDRLLDAGRFGPVHLRKPEIAGIVQAQLLEVSERGHCELHAYVVMPNHVHVMWTPLIRLPDLMRYLKGPTAMLANKLLGSPGAPFWQQEYFDRVVRSGEEFCQIRRYIDWNPVKAALAARPEDFRWSSAFKEGGL